MMFREEVRRRLLEERGAGANPLDFDEIRKLSKRPWGGPLKSNRCFCCGTGMKLANHHITPRAEGGDDAYRNKVTLCSKCHDAVEGAPWAEILARREAIRRERRPGVTPDENESRRCPTYVSFEEKGRLNSERQLQERNSARTLEEYFSLPHAPKAKSPVGILMLTVLKKFPGIAFEQAREKANALLDCAAGKRAYRIPPVLTEEEQEARRQAVRAHFRSKRGPGFLQECQETPVCSVTGRGKPSGMGFGANPLDFDATAEGAQR